MQTTVHFVALAHGLHNDRQGLARWRTRTAEVGERPSPIQPRLAPLAAFVDARGAVHTGDLGDAPAIVERAGADAPRGRYLPHARAAAAELERWARLGARFERACTLLLAGSAG